MILGVYWYFGSPAGLYDFDYFKFHAGYGGHADKPAELIATVTAPDPDQLLKALKALTDQYSEGTLYVYRAGSDFKIMTGGHQLFDYDLLLIQEVELILKHQQVQKRSELILENPTFTRLVSDRMPEKSAYPQHRFLQLVGSAMKKHHAETLQLRMDCHLPLSHKSAFIKDLKNLAVSVGITVFYYHDHDFSDQSNLMLFFTQGRQGIGLQPKQIIQTSAFESGIEKLMEKYAVQTGHLSDAGTYPQNGPHIELSADDAYVF